MNARGAKGALVVVEILILIVGATAIFNSCTSVNQSKHIKSSAFSRGDQRNFVQTGNNSLSGVLAPEDLMSLDAIIPYLASKRVVYIGETHDRYEHHLNQLKIIQRLHKIHPNLAIGMEYFQQPFQRYLDDYIAGAITEKEFLRSTEYYTRWRFDYRLYRPILSYAREQGIPIIALNVPKELSSRVAESGLNGLTEEERASIPFEIDRSDSDYRQRLRTLFEVHPALNFDYFVEAQLLWDEGMAERVAAYLRENPDHRLIVLAGSGHLAYGSGIPNRVLRRIDHESAIVLNGIDSGTDPQIADFILLPEPVELPPQGVLGIYMSESLEGVTIDAFAESSAAKDEGMKRGDQIMSLDGEPVRSSADVHLALLDKLPGDQVRVNIRRKTAEDQNQKLMIEVGLR